MFGFIHESLRQLILQNYGKETYDEVLNRANFENGRENLINHYYSDEETFRIVEAVCSVAQMSMPDVWEMYGAYLIEYTMGMGWDELLRSLGSNLKEFLDNLDALHYFVDHTVFKHPQLKGPSFRCEIKQDGQLYLHYVSNRMGLFPIVKGVIREVATRIFNMNVELIMTGRNQRTVVLNTGDRTEEHVTFLVDTKGGNLFDKASESSISEAGFNTMSTSADGLNIDGEENETGLCISGVDYSDRFPYHIIVDSDCKIVHLGLAYREFIAGQITDGSGDKSLHQLFQVVRPRIPLDFENIVNYINAVFVIQLRQKVVDDASMVSERNSLAGSVSLVSYSPLKLKGQMILLQDGKHLMYMCTPYCTDVQELLQHNMRLNQIPLYDSTRDLILLNQQRLNEVEVSKQLDDANEELKHLALELDTEKAKAEALLTEVLPKEVAKQLMAGEVVDAREYKEATVLFSDVPNFQNIVALSNPRALIKLLNELFIAFDRLITLHNVYKVETIGDSYMVVAGAPIERLDHCEAMLYVALGMIWEANSIEDPESCRALKVRVGIHSGPIVTGVIGKKMPRYCLFGDTVNTASRMESHGKAGRVHCSEAAHEAALSTGRFRFTARGSTYIKGKGLMKTYWCEESLKESLWEIVRRDRDKNFNTITGFKELSDTRSLSMFSRNSNRKMKRHGSAACTVL